nr:hypothetical protein [Tanacetum cinerariifolium]
MNMGQDRQTHNVGGNGRNQFGQPRRRDTAYVQTQLLIDQKEKVGIQLQAEEFDFMAAAGDLDGIQEVNANCILMANLQQASTSGTQHDKAPIYDTDDSAEVHLNDNCYDNEIFNMFIQDEQYTDLLEPILEAQLVPQNDNHVTSIALSERKPKKDKIGSKPEKNRKRGEAGKSQKKLQWIEEEKLKKMQKEGPEMQTHASFKERKKIEGSAKQITTLNDEISNLNKQLSKEKSSISSLMDEKKRLKHDFKIREDKFLDKEVDLEERKQDPPDVYDSEETLELAQESQEKIRFLKKEIKPANYAKINHLLGVFVPQTTKSKEELFLSNVSNMVIVSKTISIPNEDLSDDTTPSVARKFLNEVKSSLVTLQRVVKQKMTLEFHNLSSSAHKEVERLQAQLRDLKGKSSDTPSASNTLDPLNQNLESKILELEFQVVNYEREISHLKTTYKNLFDSIKSNRTHDKLHELIYENAQLRAWQFKNTSESMKNTSGTSVTPHVDKPKLGAVTPLSNKLHASMPSDSVP